MSDYSFKGGEAFQAALEDLLKKAGDAMTLRVGFLEGSTCGWENQESAPQVAFWLEFGTTRVIAKNREGSLGMETQGMPPRPFFQQMIDKNSPKWADQFVRVLKSNGYYLKGALFEMGQLIADQLQKEIMAFNDPPDARSTLERKRFKGGELATLQDSKNLLRSVDFEVVEGLQVEA